MSLTAEYFAKAFRQSYYLLRCLRGGRSARDLKAAKCFKARGAPGRHHWQVRHEGRRASATSNRRRPGFSTTPHGAFRRAFRYYYHGCDDDAADNI